MNILLFLIWLNINPGKHMYTGTCIIILKQPVPEQAEFFMVYVKNIYPVQFSLDFDTMYNALFVIDFSSDF